MSQTAYIISSYFIVTEIKNMSNPRTMKKIN